MVWRQRFSTKFSVPTTEKQNLLACGASCWYTVSYHAEGNEANMAKKYYAVRAGRKTGIFETWDECRAQTTGFKGASFKSFPTLGEAEAYMQGADSLASAPEGGDGAVAYVDGSYHAGTHEFSCGAVLFLSNEEQHFSQKFDDPQLAQMHNVAGEIKGAETVMTYCMEHDVPSVTIYHDYEGVAKWATGEWKANKPGTIAYRAFCAKAAEKLRFRFVKVKGHSGDKYNDLADRLAKDALGIK